MKTILGHLKVTFLSVLSVLTAPLIHAQSSGAISVDRSIHYTQTDATTVTAQQTPYSFIFHVRGGSVNMANWGPAFYKPGSGGVPQSGSSSATNTGTLNFPAVANNGTDYMFIHEFETNAALAAFYPIAPTDSGAYGVKFLGSGAPTPAIFTDGLVYPTNTTYPVTTPQVVSANNGATWADGKLHLQTSGITTLTLNTFTEYSSTTYGSLIAVGIFNSSGTVVAGSESYYLPVGDSTENPEPIVQPAITSINVAGASLVAGQAYTLEIQYTIIAGRPEEANLNGIEFQGVSSYRRVVTVSIVAGEASGVDFNADGHQDIVLQNTSTGERKFQFMNGTSLGAEAAFMTVNTNWSIAATADFNGDGQSDLLWENNATGDHVIFYLNGTTLTGTAVVMNVNTNWKIAAAADFNADGKPDIIWQNTVTGDRAVFYMNNATVIGTAALWNVSTNWSIAAAGDLNGDGKNDLVWQNTVTGDRAVYFMNNVTLVSATAIMNVNPSWSIAAARDFNADGKADLLWENTSSGARAIFTMNGAAVTGTSALGTMATDWRMR